MKRIALAAAALALAAGILCCGGSSGASKPAARPTVTKTVQVPGPAVTKTVTKTISNSAMTAVSVPDPSGAPSTDYGWRSQIPCVDAGGQLVIGDAGAAAGAVNETCTLTIVQLQPASEGLAVLLKDSNGNETNFSLTLAG